MIFTDGSVWEVSVDSGSCASVLFSKSDDDDDDVWVQTLAVGTKVSVLNVRWKMLVLVLQWQFIIYKRLVHETQ